jgi:hypothetical protein
MRDLLLLSPVQGGRVAHVARGGGLQGEGSWTSLAARATAARRVVGASSDGGVTAEPLDVSAAPEVRGRAL